MKSEEYNICFLRLAISNNERLLFLPTDEDWQRFFVFCKRQVLIGIGFHAMEKLHEQGIECPAALKMKWMALALKIEKKNVLMNEQCRKLTEHLEHDGLKCCILKGQGNLLNYPEELKLRRNPGDIDVWCVAPEDGLPIAVQTCKDRVKYETYHGREAIMEYVRLQHRLCGNSIYPRTMYHHMDAPAFEGTEVEVHYKPTFCRSVIRNRRMQKWFSVHKDECMANRTQEGFSIPTTSVNVVYQMCHLFNHYFCDGLGLRQLLDYYFTLKAYFQNYEFGVMNYELSAKADEELDNYKINNRNSHNKEIMNVLRSFGMGKFAAAVMWVLHEVFDMPTHYYICEPNEKEGRKLLDEIMQGGNFGQYDERGKEMKNGGTIPHAIWKLKRVMRLVSSYPEEALCEPFFRVWHWGWRQMHK